MTTFIRTTDDLPVPEVLGKPDLGNLERLLFTITRVGYGDTDAMASQIEQWGKQVHLYLRKLEKHAETLSRGLNATAQIAWGHDFGSSYLNGPITLSSANPRALSQANLNFPTPTHITVHYTAVLTIDTAPGSAESLYACVLLDGAEQSGSRELVNLGKSWASGQVVTISGSWQGQLKKDQVYRLSLAAGIENQSTGVVTAQPKHTGLIYSLRPRLAGA